MVDYLCKGCGYKFKPRSGRPGSVPSMCPACGRNGSLVETGGLINKFLKEAEGEEE
jgi:hypothetical protein